MTTKNNKEIIKEEAENLIFDELDMIMSYYGDGEIGFDSYEKQCKEVIERWANSLLSKLNKLDKENIEGYLRLKFGYRYEFEEIENRDIREAVEHLCQLIPEEGEVKEWKEKYRLEKIIVDRLIRYKRKLEKRLTEKELKKIFNKMKIRLTKGKPKKVLYVINTDDWKYLISQIMKI